LRRQYPSSNSQSARDRVSSPRPRYGPPRQLPRKSPLSPSIQVSSVLENCSEERPPGGAPAYRCSSDLSTYAPAWKGRRVASSPAPRPRAGPVGRRFDVAHLGQQFPEHPDENAERRQRQQRHVRTRQKAVHGRARAAREPLPKPRRLTTSCAGRPKTPCSRDERADGQTSGTPRVGRDGYAGARDFPAHSSIPTSRAANPSARACSRASCRSLCRPPPSAT